MKRQDFSRFEAFKAIDSYKLNAILREDFRAFLNRNGVYANALDSDYLMMRIDLDGDGRVTYKEFCSFLE